MGTVLTFLYFWTRVAKFDIHVLTDVLLSKLTLDFIRIFSARMCAETNNGPSLFAIKSCASWRSLELKKMVVSRERMWCGTTALKLNFGRNDFWLVLQPLHWAKPIHGNLSMTSFSIFSIESTANTFMQIVLWAFKSPNARRVLHGKNAARVVPLYFLFSAAFLKSKCTSMSSFPWQTPWNSFQLISVPWPRERSVRLSADTLKYSESASKPFSVGAP